jgi:hypothetical protein
MSRDIRIARKNIERSLESAAPIFKRLIGGDADLFTLHHLSELETFELTKRLIATGRAFMQELRQREHDRRSRPQRQSIKQAA